MGRKIFALIVALLFFYIASPLILPVTMGAVLATLFMPSLERLESRKLPTRLAASFLTLIITFFVVLPAAILIFVGTKEAFVQLQAVRARQAAAPYGGDGSWVNAFISMPRIHRILEHITEWFPIQLQQLTEAAQDLTRSGAARLADLMGGLVTLLPGMGIALAVSVVSVYFFLVDGRRLALFFRRNSMFSTVQTDELMSALAGTCRSVIQASVVSGAAQALLEFVVCFSVGIPNAALIGLLVFLGSFVPVIGSAPITFGVAMHQFFVEHNGRGVVLIIAAVTVMVLDNFIRPLFLRGSANLHPLLAFVAAFGGLQVLGFSGVFIGPIIAAVFVVTLQILVRPDSAAKSERPVL